MSFRDPNGQWQPHGGQDRQDYLEGWMPEDTSNNDAQVARPSEDEELAIRRTRLLKYRPRTPKKIAAWLSIGLGVMMLIGVPAGSVESLEGSGIALRMSIAVLYFLMFVGPATYWLYSNKRDTATVRRWAATEADYRDIWESLDPMTRSAFAQPTRADELPLLPKRNWEMIWIGVIILAAITGTLMPST